jgi:prepilin-type N-terminal cleavage/methylation domain-containing protein
MKSGTEIKKMRKKKIRIDSSKSSPIGMKAFCRNSRCSRRGFSLIEVLIAMAIFSIGILALTSLQIRSINQNATAKMQTAATTLAVDWMEQLISRPYDDAWLDEADSPFEVQRGSYTIVWDVNEDPNNYGLPIKQINIQVTGANRNAKVVNLTSIKWQGSGD